MSRFFKSAAFPILIVIVLAILATKVIGSGSSGPHYSFGNLLHQLDNKQVQKLTLNQKSNSAQVTLNNGQNNLTQNDGNAVANGVKVQQAKPPALVQILPTTPQTRSVNDDPS